MTRNSFLIYANRSGSTLLSTQLSKSMSADRLLVVPEFRLLEYLFHTGDAKTRSLSPSALKFMVDQDHQVEANLGLSREELIDALVSAPGEGIGVKLDRVLQAYAANNDCSAEPDVVLWKWGNAATYVREIERVFPEARFVHAIRDPRAVVNSLLRSESPYFAGEDLARGSALHGAHHWKSSIRRNRRPASAGFPLLTVRFDDLVLKPAEVMRLVGAFLSVGEPAMAEAGHTFKVSESEAGIHPLVDESPQSGRIDAWQGELAEWRRYVVEHAAADEMQACDYSASPARIPLVKRISWIGRGQVEWVVGTSSWAIRRMRRYGTRLIVRLLGMRLRAWLASRGIGQLSHPTNATD